MKPGIKTTEFWSTIVGSIVLARADELGIPLEDVVKNINSKSSEIYSCCSDIKQHLLNKLRKLKDKNLHEQRN